MYDNGEVLQGLEEEWTFMGANVIEWACGLVVFLLIGSLGSNPARAMPFMIVGMIGTSSTLSSLRKVYPDEHRGVRNMFSTALGIDPLDIPPPARLQPIWGGTPLRELPEKCAYVRAGFDELFPSFQDNLEPAIELEALEQIS